MISVCIATYNGAKFLKDQVSSILTQIAFEDEIVVSDDNSTDDTVSILREIDDERIKIYYNKIEDKGVIKNFQNAISHSNGDYIFLSDQDDVWIPNRIPAYMAEMKKLELQFTNKLPILIFSDLSVVDETLNIVIESVFKKTGQNPYLSYDSKILPVSNRIMGCTMFFNRKVKEISLPIKDIAVMHDWWIALCVAKYGHITYIDKPTLLYRQHSSNVIGSKIKNNYMEKIFSFGKILRFNIDIYRMVSLFYKMSLLKYFLLKIKSHFK